jgi:hypothetical protein
MRLDGYSPARITALTVSDKITDAHGLKFAYAMRV